MPEKVHNTRAAEFLGQADAILKEIADKDKAFTAEELDARLKEVGVLKQRAAAVADMAPEAVAARDLGLTKVAPAEAEPVEVTREEASAEIRKAFGGVGRYVLALAKQGTRFEVRWTDKQRKAHDLLQRTVVGTTSDGSGGEFVLPLTQEQNIYVGAQILQPGLWERAPRYPCPGRTVRIPYLIQTDATNDTRPLSGIAATAIEAEAGEKDEREPSIGQRIVTAFKYAAYFEAGDEILADDMTGGGLPRVLQKAVGEDLVNSINADVTISGAGTTAPLGALHTNNGALITINRNTSQNIDADDVFRMMARSTMGPRTFWLASVSTIPEVYALALTSGSQVTFLSNLRDGASAQLCGRPLVFTHLLSNLGVAGDLALIDPDQYATVARQDVTIESSIHYKFRNDVTAYRLFARAGGIPIPDSEYSFAASGGTATYTFSGFVRLGDDATS